MHIIALRNMNQMWLFNDRTSVNGNIIISVAIFNNQLTAFHIFYLKIPKKDFLYQ